MKNVYLHQVIFVLLFCVLGIITTNATAEIPAGHEGVILHVSKLGDNSDGLSWATAFNTIQAALDAVPDDKGGHRVLVRPDTYMEANLSVSHSGAADAYNHLIGDKDGSLGSGASGWVVLDSGDPKKGFKSYDWWGPIRATQQGWSKEHTDPTFSTISWDRWHLQYLYVTGGDGGLFWDCTNRVEPLTIIMEDCVSIGRAFGAGVANCLSRSEEPITFRRCLLWALDWWGDTAAAYVRVENESMPDQPDVIFDGCTMASPQCALKGGNYGFHTYSRIKTKNCKLVTLNFSQPVGTPSDGTIVSMQNGKYLHFDLEDTTIMGYKVFGVKVDADSAKDIQFTTTGDVRAYVQFTQEVPKGMLRGDHWPADVFASIAPPVVTRTPPVLQRNDWKLKDLCEVSHIFWKDRLCRMECIRPGQGGERKDYYLLLLDAETGEELARFAEGYGLACAFVHEDVFYAFASRFEDNNWNDVTIFRSEDLKTWTSAVIVEQENEHLFNSSVCKGKDGFVLAYESNDPTWPAFTTKFASSPDLQQWTKLPEATFGTNRYTACPNIHYANGYYYVLYLEHRNPCWFFETYITRSSDLKHWALSAANPVISPEGTDEGINASDPDLIECGDTTRLYFAVGDQRTWMDIKYTEYEGGLADFLEYWYTTPGIPDCGAVSTQ